MLLVFLLRVSSVRILRRLYVYAVLVVRMWSPPAKFRHDREVVRRVCRRRQTSSLHGLRYEIPSTDRRKKQTSFVSQPIHHFRQLCRLFHSEADNQTLPSRYALRKWLIA